MSILLMYVYFRKPAVPNPWTAAHKWAASSMQVLDREPYNIKYYIYYMHINTYIDVLLVGLKIGGPHN